VTGVSPVAAPNDLNTPITITGTGFTTGLTGAQVLTVPQVHLGNSRLENVGVENDTTLTATVPWGLATGIYPLTVTNQDGQSGNLPQAFTVTQGIEMWNSGGPYGGDIWHIVVNPLQPTQLLTTGMWSGLFASEDKAAQWRTAFIGAFPVRPAIDAENHQVIYAGSAGTIARSDDGGVTWQQLAHHRVCVDDVYPFAHPTITGKVFFAVACRQDAGDSSDGSGLYVSTDWGTTWIATTNGLTDTNVTALAFHPDDPELMLAGTRDGNVFISDDGGSSWSFAKKVSDHIERLVFNPFGEHEAWAVIAGPYPYSMNRTAIFKSTNTEFTEWESVTINPQYNIWSLTFDPTQNGTIYAGSGAGYVSTDGGENWQQLGSGLPIGTWQDGVKEITFDPQDNQRLYAATPRGVYQSEDGGGTWFKSDHGLGGVLPTSLAVSPFDPQKAYAATLGADILRTVDGGQTWQKINIPWLEWTSNLATDPFIDERLYNGASCGGDILISPDGGLTYETIKLTLPDTYSSSSAFCVTSIVPDSHHPGYILAGVAIPFGSERSDWRGGFFASEDYGETWHWVDVGRDISSVATLVFDPNNPLIVYAGTDSGELLRSDDGGAIWHQLNDYDGTHTITAIAIHPDNSQIIFVSGQNPNAIMISTDGGNTWTPLTNQPTTGPVWALRFALTTPPALYAGTMSDGLWRTTDNGRTWSVASGLSQGNVRSLVTATDGERAIVYVGISNGALTDSASYGINEDRVTSDTTLLGSGVFRLSTSLLHQRVYLPFIRG
jgi:photosystem II stability/assembly factor-like uncharacterized protein